MTRDKRKATTSVSDETDPPWKCNMCNNNFGNPDDKVIECDRCRKHFCIKCHKMPQSVYDYMASTPTIWCCAVCTPEARTILSDKAKSSKVDHSKKLEQEMSNMRSDLDTTMSSMKAIMTDLYCFMNGPKPKTATPDDGSVDPVTPNAWDITKAPVKPLKEILIEANQEQKREN